MSVVKIEHLSTHFCTIFVSSHIELWSFLPYVTASFVAGWVPSGLDTFRVIIVKSKLRFSWSWNGSVIWRTKYEVSFLFFTSIFLQYVTVPMEVSCWHCVQCFKTILQLFQSKSTIKMDKKKVWALQYVCNKNCTIAVCSFGRVS